MHSCSKEVTGLQSGHLEERVCVTDVALAFSEFCVNILLGDRWKQLFVSCLTSCCALVMIGKWNCSYNTCYTDSWPSCFFTIQCLHTETLTTLSSQKKPGLSCHLPIVIVPRRTSPQCAPWLYLSCLQTDHAHLMSCYCFGVSIIYFVVCKKQANKPETLTVQTAFQAPNSTVVEDNTKKHCHMWSKLVIWCKQLFHIWYII